MQIVNGTNCQPGGNEKPHQAAGPNCHSPLPHTIAQRGSAHYQPPIAALRNLGGCELPCRVPVPLHGRLHLQTWAGALELLVAAGVVRRERINLPLDEANQLVSIFVASLRTVKGLKSEI